MMLSRRISIITGGSSGIGEAIARRFAKEGAAVAILDRDLPGAERVAQTLADADVMCIRCDVSIDAEVSAAIDAVVNRHGRIDILVNNAGIPPTIAPLDSKIIGRREDLRSASPSVLKRSHGQCCFLRPTNRPTSPASRCPSTAASWPVLWRGEHCDFPHDSGNGDSDLKRPRPEVGSNRRRVNRRIAVRVRL